MKCPLSNYVMERESGEDEVLLNDCLKEECAWWDRTDETCSILSLDGDLARIGTLLSMLHTEICLSKYTYRCHDCGVTIEKTAVGEFKTPTGWGRKEQIDGKFTWICDKCSPETTKRR